MWWTQQRRRADGVAGQVYLVSEIRRAGRTALKRTAKPCGPDTRGWCQAVGGDIDPTGSISHQAGSDGGKTNSSPGRARHKPSNHCAGNAGVLRLYLYARVRTSSCTLHTRPRVQQAPGIPCSLCFEGKEFQQSSGAIRAARSRSHIFVLCLHPSRRPCERRDPYTAADVVLVGWVTASFSNWRRWLWSLRSQGRLMRGPWPSPFEALLYRLKLLISDTLPSR
jgi:hypothetical protein